MRRAFLRDRPALRAGVRRAFLGDRPALRAGVLRAVLRAAAPAAVVLFCLVPTVHCPVLPFGLVTAVSAQSSSPQDIADSVERLKKLRADLEAKRKVAQDLGGQEQSVLGEIRELEQVQRLTRKILKELEERETALNRELSLTREALEASRARLDLRKQELAKALRQMYKHGRYHSLEILFSSRSFPNLLERFRFLGSVAVRNRQILYAVEQEQARYDETYRTLTDQSQDLEELKKDRKREEARVEADMEKRTGILESIRSEKSRYEQMVADLERSAQELEVLIARMEEARTRAVPAGRGDFEALKGRLPRPVEGELAVSFGKHRHPKFGTVTISNGVDYRAALGSPVRAVAAGRVEHVSWLTGYGQCVILSHGNGYYTLYAHCSEVFVQSGQDVSGGATIASVGDTGSLIGPALHFEIRRGREALNPAEWMSGP